MCSAFLGNSAGFAGSWNLTGQFGKWRDSGRHESFPDDQNESACAFSSHYLSAPLSLARSKGF
jgi:hypothetical protein